MIKYAALLRGIGPGNPNMRNEKLRKVLEDLGYKNVRSVISSGNIVFNSARTDRKAMEAEIEAAWQDKLGFVSTTIIRSQPELASLIKQDPFKGLAHGPSSYLLVTFFKRPPTVDFRLPFQPEGKTYKFIGPTDAALYSVTDNTVVKTTDLMTWIERRFGKDITSRTWLTVNRIVKKMTEA